MPGEPLNQSKGYRRSVWLDRDLVDEITAAGLKLTEVIRHALRATALQLREQQCTKNKGKKNL